MPGIYLHIPYCSQKCTYCDFYFKISQNDKLDLLVCMKKEIKFSNNYFNNETIDSIYFGGGTPSVLNLHEIKNILNCINKNYSVDSNVEITLEANPEDINLNLVKEYKKAGINRLSIGVQSFNDKELKFMNRSHNAQEAINSIKIAQNEIKQISVDLIYGLPNQKLSDWERNLISLFKFNIDHFSAYALTIEKKTKLHYLVKSKQIKPICDDKATKQFELLQKMSQEHNFLHYEISNFCKTNKFSKHNLGYWTKNKYLGIGPSAHSFNGKIRKWNKPSNKTYINGVLNNLNYYNFEILKKNEIYNEYIYTGLRTMWGVDEMYLEQNFRLPYYKFFKKEIQKWISKKFVVKNKNKYILTKEGKKFADGISSDLFIINQEEILKKYDS